MATTTSTSTISTTCSDCTSDLKVNLKTLEVSGRVPSNGIRGAKHVPAHNVTAEAWVEDGDVDEAMVYWECPVCGHADSFWNEDV